ncbi:MAG: hypothetical protein HC945_01890 [Nitrosarchaeum sp.]|nr:hypothetical protein [Nitrosarchaeum sp.]
MRWVVVLVVVLACLGSVLGVGEPCVSDADCDGDPQVVESCDGTSRVVTTIVEVCDLEALNPVCVVQEDVDVEMCADLCCDGLCVSAACAGDAECAAGACSAGVCSQPGTCSASCASTPLSACESGVSCPALASTCPDAICSVPTCLDGCGLTPVAALGNDGGCEAPKYCDGQGGCVTPPACSDGVLVTSAAPCDCSGVLLTAGYCCSGVSQSTPCGELPSYCDDLDGDGYYQEDPGCGVVDCDDARADRHPGLLEVCGNAVDEDCDGEDLACTPCGEYAHGECLDEQYCDGGTWVYKCSVCGCREGRSCDRSLEVCVLGGVADAVQESSPAASLSDLFAKTQACVPQWTCSDWGVCASSRVQKRVCTDANACGSAKGMPSQTRLCAPSADAPVEAASGDSKSLSDVLGARQLQGGSRDALPGNGSAAQVAKEGAAVLETQVSGEEDSSALMWGLGALLVAVMVVLFFRLRSRSSRAPAKPLTTHEIQLKSLHSLAARIHALREQGMLEGQVDAQLHAEGWFEDVIARAKEQLSVTLGVRSEAEAAAAPAFIPTPGEKARGDANAQGRRDEPDDDVPAPPKA